MTQKASGTSPAVDDPTQAAGIARSTAYRYFPSLQGTLTDNEIHRLVLSIRIAIGIDRLNAMDRQRREQRASG
ncbi:hypothetical protein [Arthrobacter sp. ISL-95]|uniref:hypothetical protein n=1 Tax=Arthrobacter sp. ISL-95 TaxID=2819116 RepID=UPI001BE6E1AD|nr:hypothetical protein [Arthrobacter sp. ISL-95]MBT2587657.1 hypothetical protein [Arthrobacter sp. ISL-95]